MAASDLVVVSSLREGGPLIVAEALLVHKPVIATDVGMVREFIPEKYINGKYHVFGNFCSFGCAFAYNDNSINDYRRQIRDSLLKKLYKDIFNKKYKHSKILI